MQKEYGKGSLNVPEDVIQAGRRSPCNSPRFIKQYSRAARLRIKRRPPLPRRGRVGVVRRSPNLFYLRRQVRKVADGTTWQSTRCAEFCVAFPKSSAALRE